MITMRHMWYKPGKPSREVLEPLAGFYCCVPDVEIHSLLVIGKFAWVQITKGSKNLVLNRQNPNLKATDVYMV